MIKRERLYNSIVCIVLMPLNYVVVSMFAIWIATLSLLNLSDFITLIIVSINYFKIVTIPITVILCLFTILAGILYFYKNNSQREEKQWKQKKNYLKNI